MTYRTPLLRAIFVVALAIAPLLAAAAAEAKGSRSGGGSHSVRGYTKKNGTYVKPHRQTNPNTTKRDNWSTKGNTNPATGKRGTKKPY